MSVVWEPQLGKCAFCGRGENCYALQDNKGEWQGACNECCKNRAKEKRKDDNQSTTSTE
jgi:hypothetical protein